MRHAWMAALVLGAALAGCLSKDDEQPEEKPEPAPVEAFSVVFHRGEALLGLLEVPAAWANLTIEWRSVDGRDAREPTVAVTSDGALYYAARDYSGGQAPPATSTQTPVMKSTDGGLTWTDVSPRLPSGDREPPRSGDPMVVADPWTDRVFQIELYDLVCNWLVWTDDGGSTWGSNPKACGSLVVDHQTITAGPSKTGLPLQGYPNMVYVCVNQVADSHCARSLDGGQSFGSFDLVFPSADPGRPGSLCGGIHGHALVGPDGTVYLPREYCEQAFVGISRDDGTTWERIRVDGGLGEYGNDPNMAFDAAGNVYYAFTSSGTNAGVFVTWTKDQGRTWSEPVRASPPDLTFANHPSITAGDDGRIGLVFLGTQSDLSRSEDTWEWHSYMGLSWDATNETPTFATLQANPEDDVNYRGDCRGIRCGYIREFLDASIAPDGSFWGAFVDACLPADAAKYGDPKKDCDTVADDFASGNGHLGYAARLANATLYQGERVISGSG